MGLWVLPNGVDESGSILERGLDGSLKSSREVLDLEDLEDLCKHTGGVKFKVILLEICMAKIALGKLAYMG